MEIIPIIPKIAFVIVWISANMYNSVKAEDLKHKLHAKYELIKPLEIELESSLLELGEYLYACSKCQHHTYYIGELTKRSIELHCIKRRKKIVLRHQNPMYQIDVIPKIYALLYEEIYELVWDEELVKKGLNSKINPPFVKEFKPADEFFDNMRYRFIEKKFIKSRGYHTWNYTHDNLRVIATGLKKKEIDAIISFRAIDSINPQRAALDSKTENAWNYKTITSGVKGRIIKEWARNVGIRCPDGRICGGISFKELPDSEISFGHIIPQSWAKEFPNFYEKVHHADNLYLSCRRCNSSLSDSFPEKELKNRINNESGTIGDWLRNNKRAIEEIR